MAPVALVSPRRRSASARPLAVVLAGAVGLLALAQVLAPAFIPGAAPPARRGAATALRAEGFPEPTKDGGDGGDGGFMKFLKVEQEIELSPEEYKIALDQEIESQRKRYYIGGDVKPNNLIVPWKPVDEKQLDADARRQLKKNGINDPSGATGPGDRDASEDSPISVMIIGEQDVQIEWTAGEPEQKVGYVVERKRPSDTNFEEIASYDQERTSFLLVQPYAGHEYAYSDEIVAPGQYTYRVLCRVRSGEVSVVDQKDIEVPDLSGVDSGLALAVFGVILVGSLVGAYFADPIIT